MRKIELYLSLGSNLGNRRFYLEQAIRLLDEAFGIHYKALSSMIETEPWGFESTERFINAAVMYELDFPDTFSPEKAGEAILDICKDIEHSLGRNSGPMYGKDGSRIYSSRTIDIDILLLGNERIKTERLTVPHGLIKCRDFVMTPLREVASELAINAFPDLFN